MIRRLVDKLADLMGVYWNSKVAAEFRGFIFKNKQQSILSYTLGFKMYPAIADNIDKLSANYWKLKGFYSFPDNLKGEL